MVVRLAVWIIALYAGLKLAQWAATPRVGYTASNIGLGARVMRGEPWLLLAAILLPTAGFAYSHWWVHRWATRGLAHATDCIGQLGSLDRLPGVYRRFKRTDIADSALSYYSLAQDQGARLSIDSSRINAAVTARRRAYGVAYADLARSGDAARIERQFGSIDRCLKDEWPHDGLLNP